jgi:hypothetical protein
VLARGRPPEPPSVLGVVATLAQQLDLGYPLSPGDWVLIRPDGYVALVTADVATVESYLDQVGLRPPQSREESAARLRGEQASSAVSSVVPRPAGWLRWWARPCRVAAGC